MNYPYKTYKMQVEEHVFWVAESTCLKGCVGQGDDLEEAVQELEENEEVWLETAKECDIDIPKIPIETVSEYSGKFTVRVSPTVHREAVRYAQKEGISMNQYINDAIVSQNARYETAAYIAPEIKNTIETLRALTFDNPPTSSKGTAEVIDISGWRSFDKQTETYAEGGEIWSS